MYTNTAAANFLVLSPNQAGSNEPSPRVRSDGFSSTSSSTSTDTNFLILSPTQAGPHHVRSDSTSSTDTNFLVLSPTHAGPHHTSISRARSDSSSSADSNASQLKEAGALSPSPLPAGFLFLGYDA